MFSFLLLFNIPVGKQHGSVQFVIRRRRSTNLYWMGRKLFLTFLLGTGVYNLKTRVWYYSEGISLN